MTIDLKKGLKVTSFIVPSSIKDTYPTHIDSLGFAGYRVVDTLEELNKIPDLRKKVGMLVYVIEDSKIYILTTDGWKVKIPFLTTDSVTPILPTNIPTDILKTFFPNNEIPLLNGGDVLRGTTEGQVIATNALTKLEVDFSAFKTLYYAWREGTKFVIGGEPSFITRAFNYSAQWLYDLDSENPEDINILKTKSGTLSRAIAGTDYVYTQIQPEQARVSLIEALPIGVDDKKLVSRSSIIVTKNAGTNDNVAGINQLTVDSLVSNNIDLNLNDAHIFYGNNLNKATKVTFRSAHESLLRALNNIGILKTDLTGQVSIARGGGKNVLVDDYVNPQVFVEETEALNLKVTEAQTTADTALEAVEGLWASFAEAVEAQLAVDAVFAIGELLGFATQLASAYRLNELREQTIHLTGANSKLNDYKTQYNITFDNNGNPNQASYESGISILSRDSSTTDIFGSELSPVYLRIGGMSHFIQYFNNTEYFEVKVEFKNGSDGYTKWNPKKLKISLGRHYDQQLARSNGQFSKGEVLQEIAEYDVDTKIWEFKQEVKASKMHVTNELTIPIWTSELTINPADYKEGTMFLAKIP